MSPSNGHTRRVWAALLVVYLIWGSTYLGIAVVVQQAPALLSAGSRFLAAGLLLGIAVVIRGGAGRLFVPWRHVLGGMALGCIMLGVGNGGVSLAERFVPSGVTALLIATVPIWIIVFRVAGGQRPSWRTAVGVLVGLAGVGLLVWFVGAHDPDPGRGYQDASGWALLLWMVVILLGSLSWAVGSFLSPTWATRGRAPADPLTGAAWQLFGAGCALLLASAAVREDWSQVGELTSVTMSTWLLLVLGALVAYTCYVWLLSNAPVSLVSTYAYVNPAVAVVLGFVLLGEPFGPGSLAATGLVLLGVGLVVRGEQPSKQIQELRPAVVDTA